MKFVLSVFVLCFAISAEAQYYYNDVIATRDLNALMKSYIDNKVKSVSATGYDERGAKATDFAEVTEIKENGTVMRTATIVKMSKTVVLSKYDAQARLIESVDSLVGAQNVTRYTYDAEGRVKKIENTTRGVGSDFDQVEIHEWFYTRSGRPDRMLRTINKADTLEIKFIGDENDNAGEEVTYNHGKETDRVYYYYDSQKRITDIVRYNKKIKKLMPEQMLDYDEAGHVTQLISSMAPAKFGKMTWVGYQIWKYLYSEKGLKMEERVYNHAQDLVGKVKYSFRYDR